MPMEFASLSASLIGITVAKRHMERQEIMSVIISDFILMFSREYGSPGIRPLPVSCWGWVAVTNTRNTQNVGDGWKSDVGSRKSNEMVGARIPRDRQTRN